MIPRDNHCVNNILKVVEIDSKPDDSSAMSQEVEHNGDGQPDGPNEPLWSLEFQGAEARVWSSVRDGVHVIKKERFVKKYRVTELDTRLTRKRIKAEVRAITKIKDKCPDLGSRMADILYVDNNSIVMTKIEDSINVCEYLQKTSDKPNGQSNEGLLMESIGETIAQIHNCGVIHGDLTTSNFLIKNQDPKLLVPIDFGLSSFSTSAEDRAVDLYVLERALLSTHPNIDFNKVLQSYDKNIEKTKNDVLKRLEMVRQRGRKKLLIG